jgi:hypothetical protein
MGGFSVMVAVVSRLLRIAGSYKPSVAVHCADSYMPFVAVIWVPLDREGLFSGNNYWAVVADSPAQIKASSGYS